MKTERVLPSLSSSAEGFDALFELVDAPAALCDDALRVLRANSAFEVMTGERPVEGRPLTEFATHELAVPAPGQTSELEVEFRSGQSVTLSLSRRGHFVAVMARRLSPMLDSLAAAGRALIEQARIETQLLEIGRSVAGATSEEELIATVARGVKGLFPGRTFCVRIADPRTCALTSLYAEGRLREGRRDQFHLRRSMIDKTHLDTSHLPSERVIMTNGHDLPLLFHGCNRGIAAPLVASGQLFGAVNVEYPQDFVSDMISDERILIQLANQVAVAVRNAKLIDELSFMRKYLEELLEHANALILVANRDGRIVVFNAAMVKLTGFAKGDVLGHDIARLVPEAERLRLLRMLDDALGGRQTAGQELYLSTRDHHEIRVAFATSAVTSQNGEIEGVMCIGQDLTRTRELERHIVQAEKLASLGQLAASVVHEINNPMTAVATYADALLKRAMTTPRDPADVEKFRRIVENSERVLRFTRDLVSYARPAQEKPEEIDLDAVIERAAGFCEHVVQKHGVTLERKPGGLPRFLAVRQNLVQVFVNLITNACHATPAGGRLTIATQRSENEFAEVVVADNGRGIQPEHLGRIFEPFFSTKADGKGTGLGLCIVQGIIENHGGTITVHSEVDVGTRFVIRLPMLRPAR